MYTAGIKASAAMDTRYEDNLDGGKIKAGCLSMQFQKKASQSNYRSLKEKLHYMVPIAILTPAQYGMITFYLVSMATRKLSFPMNLLQLRENRMRPLYHFIVT